MSRESRPTAKNPDLRAGRGAQEETRGAMRVLVRIAALGGLYALLTVLPPFNAISYGPVQVRVAESLTVLPYFLPWAPWGLYLGCILANLASPFLIWDLTVGALATLVAAFLTRKAPGPHLAPLPPVIVNALAVAAYVGPLSGLPYWSVALYIGLGELIACYGLGYPLILILSRNDRLRAFLRG